MGLVYVVFSTTFSTESKYSEEQIICSAVGPAVGLSSTTNGQHWGAAQLEFSHLCVLGWPWHTGHWWGEEKDRQQDHSPWRNLTNPALGQNNHVQSDPAVKSQQCEPGKALPSQRGVCCGHRGGRDSSTTFIKLTVPSLPCHCSA